MRVMTTYRVHLTGWMHDDTFEDHADVVAASEAEAIEAAIKVVQDRWDGVLEVGDANVERLIVGPVNAPHNALREAVTGRVESGEAEAIVEELATTSSRSLIATAHRREARELARAERRWRHRRGDDRLLRAILKVFS